VNNNWSAFTDFESVKRRAGGRRHYNSVRKLRAQVRKLEAGILFLKGMKKADIARQLGVHRSTITRDVQAQFRELNENRKCPLCGSKYV